MKYFWALILPPVAIMLCKKPGQFFLNIILCALGWIPGIVHALFAAASYEANERNQALIKAISEGKRI